MSALLVYGHRGAPREAIENTIDSFDVAEARGVDGIELDVRVAASGELVLHHDPDFHSDGRQYMISTLTWRELQELRPERDGRIYRIPSLDEVLARYRHDLRYFVEIKACNVPTPGIYEQALARIVRRYGLTDHVIVLSFSMELLRRVESAFPEVASSLVFEHPAAITDLGKPNFPKVSALHPKWTILDAELAEKAKAAGLPLHAWTVNEVDPLARFESLGVASVTTDEPGSILAALGRANTPVASASETAASDASIA